MKVLKRIEQKKTKYLFKCTNCDSTLEVEDSDIKREYENYFVCPVCNLRNYIGDSKNLAIAAEEYERYTK